MEKNKLLSQFGEILRKKRFELGISQEELAFRCDFDRTYISLLERGKRNITFSNLVRLAKGLEVSVSELVNKI